MKYIPIILFITMIILPGIYAEEEENSSPSILGDNPNWIGGIATILIGLGIIVYVFYRKKRVQEEEKNYVFR